jgi:hypothetical protein
MLNSVQISVPVHTIRLEDMRRPVVFYCFGSLVKISFKVPSNIILN